MRWTTWRPPLAGAYMMCLLVPLAGCSRSGLPLSFDDPAELNTGGESESANGGQSAGGTEPLTTTGGRASGVGGTAARGGFFGIGGGLAAGGTLGVGRLPNIGGAPSVGGSSSVGGAPSAGGTTSAPPCFCPQTQVCDEETGACSCPEGHLLMPADSSTCVLDTCEGVTCGGQGSCSIADNGLAQCDCQGEWSGLSCNQKWHDIQVPPFTMGAAFDAAGNGWFATTQGLLFWDFNDTLGTKADDAWQLFPNFGASHGSTVGLDSIIIDSRDRKWIPDGYNLRRLDDNATPTDPADDSWTNYQLISGLGQAGITRISLDRDDRLWLLRRSESGVWVLPDLDLLDAPELPKIAEPEWTLLFSSELIADLKFRDESVWVAAESGLYFVTLGGTPLDESDDVWTAFSSVSALSAEPVINIEVHEASDTTWFNTERGIVQLLDGGDPLDETTNTWTEWAPQLEGVARIIGPVIGMDDDAGVWLRSPQGAALRVESGGVGDDSLTEYHPLTSEQYAGFEQYENVFGLALESEEKLWLSLGARVLLFDNGGTATDISDDTWTFFGRPEGVPYAQEVHLLPSGLLQIKTHRSDITSTPGCGGTESLHYLEPGDLLNGLDDAWTRHPISDELPRCFTLYAPDDRGQSWMKESSWFDDEEAWLLLDHAGTVGLADDSLVFWPHQALSIFDFSGAAVEPAGGLWVGNVYYDYGSLPADKSDDDIWTLGAESPRALAQDSSGGRWFGYRMVEVDEGAAPYFPLRYLDDGGTLQVTDDHRWVTFSAEDGVPFNNVREIQINDLGEKWLLRTPTDAQPQLGHLDDGGTPTDKSDDTWSSYSTNDGLNDSKIRSLVVAPGGGVWIGTHDGLQYLELNR